MKAARTFKGKQPLYVLPYGIEVIGEYAPRGKNSYWRVRIRPHPFFNAKIVCGGMYVRRNRAVMASILGRALAPDEHVHHKNEDRGDDSPGNLKLMHKSKHNSLHKKGSRHTEGTKAKIGLGMRLAYQEGRFKREWQRGTEQSQAKLDDDKVRHIRASDEGCVALAKKYGVSKQVILAVRHRKNWRHVE